MPELPMTERQRREREYYDTFCERTAPAEISFDPVRGEEQRPWNPYWSLCETVKRQFRSNGQRLLDFGCGPGVYAVMFAKLGYEAFGFDITPRNISTAQQLARKYGLAESTHFSIGAAEELPYPAEYFDVAVGVDILHHVNIAKAIEECMRVLKRGGIAVFKEPVEVPVFDPLRNTAFGRWLVPNEASFARHITVDERKLTSSDLAAIKHICADMSVKHFRLFSRLDALHLKLATGKNASLVEKFDAQVFKLVPFMRRYGGNIVITLKKK